MAEQTTQRRKNMLRVKLTDEERETFAAAAEFAGITLSSWARMELRRAAAISLRAVGKDLDITL